MSCSPFDLRDYFLRELADPQRLEVEAHVRNCPACCEELARLGITQTALLALGDEEIPQRIAFVSDPVFEPSPWRRWWSALWGSSARLGFASAAMLSAAILVSALTRPAPAPVPQAQAATVTSAEVDRRIADSEARMEKKTVLLVKDLEQRTASEHQLRIAAEKDVEYYQHQAQYMARAEYRSPENGGGPQ